MAEPVETTKPTVNEAEEEASITQELGTEELDQVSGGGGDTSQWIRVAHPWGVKGAVPKVDDEVLVTFEHGARPEK